jgi:hypothetical protein
MENNENEVDVTRIRSRLSKLTELVNEVYGSRLITKKEWEINRQLIREIHAIRLELLLTKIEENGNEAGN